ncbi:MAG: serine/threonine-protein phosphatase [Chloroflexi bacterium HGW-Chloroflexi-6]|nr:MAG: serine/threonine-protein phosphatase [Chloroflexi bacterium HGW-Chloroflexi-6]
MLNFFRKIFGRTEEPVKHALDNVVTAPLSDVQLQSIRAMTANRFEPVQLLVTSAQSIGRQRELNEDSLFTLATTIAGHTSTAPFGLFIIADGMGGHQYGEIASNTAIRVISGYILKKFHNTLFGQPSIPVEESLQEIMQAAIAEAQRVVLNEAPGSGTTVTAALVVGQQLTIGHVGDSRGYLFYNDQRMEAITRDHSLVRRLEELGQITSAEAAVHPQRNVLYRALGQGETLDPDLSTIPFPVGGYLLLCSDGLWGVVPDDEMKKIISEAPTIQRACQNLISSANASGGPDNISAVLVQLLG